MSTQTTTCTGARRTGWQLERMLFAIAGTVVILASVLALTVTPWFALLATFAGVNQWVYVLVGDCPMSVFLTRVLHVRRGISR